MLEYIYVDLWGPLLVMSAGNVRYFIMLIDSMTLFRHVEFLKKKTVEMMLEVLKIYMIKTEWLIE